MILFLIPVILLVLIVLFVRYADAHHRPSTWQDVELRKNPKNYGSGGQTYSHPQVRMAMFGDDFDDDDDDFDDDNFDDDYYDNYCDNDDYDDDYDDEFENDFPSDGGFSDSADGDSSDGDFYGGLPFGDGKIFMTDDDDFIDEFGDDVV